MMSTEKQTKPEKEFFLRKSTVVLLISSVVISLVFGLAYAHLQRTCPFSTWIPAEDPIFQTEDDPDPINADYMIPRKCTSLDFDYLLVEGTPLVGLCLWAAFILRLRADILRKRRALRRGRRRSGSSSHREHDEHRRRRRKTDWVAVVKDFWWRLNHPVRKKHRRRSTRHGSLSARPAAIESATISGSGMEPDVAVKSRPAVDEIGNP